MNILKNRIISPKQSFVHLFLYYYLKFHFLEILELCFLENIMLLLNKSSDYCFFCVYVCVGYVQSMDAVKRKG